MKKILGFITLLFITGSANAALINLDFSGVPTGTISGTSVVEDGFTLTRVGSFSWSKKSVSGVDMIDGHDHDFGNGRFFELTENNGTTFDILDMQFAITFSGEAMRITNDLGGVVNLTDNGSNNARSFSFDSTWTNLSFVRFDSDFDITVGDINLNNTPNAVPLPGTITLLGLGLLGLGFTRRKNA